MGRKKRWEDDSIVDGVGNFYLSNWKYFSAFIQEELLDYDDYVFRGQACSSWKLESSLSRDFKNSKNFRADMHLNEFVMASRGRRGFFPDQIEKEDDWWALGQHYGLKTPLLDWSVSPFVAAYFAFQEVISEVEEYRVVYALHYYSIYDKYRKMIEEHKKNKDENRTIPRMVRFVEPYLDQNSRLVNQRGLFTKLPIDIDLESWVRKEFKGVTNGYILMKIHIPNIRRTEVLRQLNRMNINPLTLFPDLVGASEYCNNKIMIKSY